MEEMTYENKKEKQKSPPETDGDFMQLYTVSFRLLVSR